MRDADEVLVVLLPHVGPLFPALTGTDDDRADAVLCAVAHDIRRYLVHHVPHETVMAQGQAPQVRAVSLPVPRPPGDDADCLRLLFVEGPVLGKDRTAFVHPGRMVRRYDGRDVVRSEIQSRNVRAGG